MSDPLRNHLSALLAGRGAHVSFEDAALETFPPKLRGSRPSGAPHSAWQLLEHMRIAQWDMLQFCLDPQHESPKWPDEYWPEAAAPSDGRAWDESLARFKADLESMRAMVRDPHRDLFTPCPVDSGKPLLRNVLVIADHNSYHLGQLIFVRKMLEHPEK